MVKKLVKQLLIQKENKRYKRLLAARKPNYGKWLKEKETLWRAEDGEENAGKEGGAAEFVMACVGDGKPASYAHKNITRYFKENQEVQILYGDEDVLTPEREYTSPWFKPDWSPDLFDSCFYFGSLTVVRREHWEKMAELYQKAYPGQQTDSFGTMESDGRFLVSDLDAFEKWMHFCAKDGYEKGSRLVGHLPQILFHAVSEEEQQRFLRESAYLKECKEQRLRMFWETYVETEKDVPLVSIVIPSKDQPEILGQCFEGIRAAAQGVSCEIILVDNGSSSENKEKIEALLEQHRADAVGAAIPATYLYRPMEFNFSGMCNLGADAAKGKLLLFLNDDVKMEKGIDEMAACALRSYTGAVGPKLLYPGNELIQHTGVVNLSIGPVHKLQHHDDNKRYYFGRNRFNCNCVAVTGACLMLEVGKFKEAGGFQEVLRVAYNDVELGFRLVELGYHNLVINDFSAEHYESLSRGDDDTPEKSRRLRQEWEQLYCMHPTFVGRDPYYPDGLNRDELDSRMLPAYIYYWNRVQENAWQPFKLSLENIRRDDCLMVRVDTYGPERIHGYSVVLGDDNACYEKYLLLLPEKSGGQSFVMKAEGQYRSDLVENLPDQKNVALGGFSVSRQNEALEPGVYRIGLMAVNRVTGLKLWNESGKSVEIYPETVEEGQR